VAIEATYGSYWAVDTLQEMGANVHLVNPPGLAWENRRVKDDYRDCCDLLDRMRPGKSPDAWIAPHAVRELRALVRFRARLVMLRTGLKAQLRNLEANTDQAEPRGGHDQRMESHPQCRDHPLRRPSCPLTK
jgi:transposase